VLAACGDGRSRDGGTDAGTPADAAAAADDAAAEDGSTSSSGDASGSDGALVDATVDGALDDADVADAAVDADAVDAAADAGPTCGNGQIDGLEACDDMDVDDADGCTSSCVRGVVCNATEYPGGDAFAVDPGTGHCFVGYADEATTFVDASSACQAAGGTLATITSAVEESYALAAQISGQNPWIGAVDDGNDTDDVFAWVTGEPWLFRHFAQGEPDDGGECLHLVDALGAWNDTNCGFAGFVVGRLCEFE